MSEECSHVLKPHASASANATSAGMSTSWKTLDGQATEARRGMVSQLRHWLSFPLPVPAVHDEHFASAVTVDRDVTRSVLNPGQQQNAILLSHFA